LKLNSTGKLISPGTTDVFHGGNVMWQPDANILSFKVRGKFLAHHHPFTFRPSHHLNPTLRLSVSPEDKPDYVWKYTIIYTTTGSSHRHRLDPKIAVKSNPITPAQLTFAFPLMLAIVTLRARRYFQKIKLQIERSARDYKRSFQKY
ncbi:MAG TPA: hypothetical protein VGI61_13155, partial [Parafilimonas sp.]